MILREIVTKLGFTIDDKKLKDFENSINKVKTNIKGLAGAANLAKSAVFAIVAAATGLSLLSLHTAKSVRATEQLADKLGLTAQELQSVELAAQSTGLGVNELSDSMNSFHKKLGDIGQGSTEASREMMRLGIVFTDTNGKIKSSFQLYEELAQKIDSIKSPIARAAALQRVLGTDNIELAKLFRDGGAALRTQREEIEKISYIIDSKGVKSSKEFLKSWGEFQIIIGSVKKELSVKFMPVFNNMMKVFKEWFGQNRKLISQNITSFINLLSIALGGLFKAFQVLMTPVNALITGMGGLENVVSVFGTALAVIYTPRIWSAVIATRAWTVALLANPVTWITVAVGALAVAIGLLVNDLWSWSQNNTSVIGYVLKEWFGFEEDFKGIMARMSDALAPILEPILHPHKFHQKLLDRFNELMEEDAAIEAGHIGGANKKITSNLTSYQQKLLSGDASFSNYIDRPIVNPISTTNGIVASNPYNPGGKVSQYITENISINVPSGTTSEQSRVIATQVAEAMQMQFNVNMLRATDGLSNR
jgi:hypothetical protein